MKWPIDSVQTWQILRALVRSRNKPLPGRVLRLDKSRRTKSGEFLNVMVAKGLIKVVGVVMPKPPKSPYSKMEAAPFLATYELTPEGWVAAEFGEFERPDPAPLPVRDVKPLGAKKIVKEKKIHD